MPGYNPNNFNHKGKYLFRRIHHDSHGSFNCAIVHFLIYISISSLGLETTNKEIFIMDSYFIETASFMGPMICPVFKILFKLLLVLFNPWIIAQFVGQDCLYIKLIFRIYNCFACHIRKFRIISVAKSRGRCSR